MKKIVVLVGSVRPGSINLKLARAIERLAAPTLAFDFVDLGALPHYDEDLWADPPAVVTDLKRRAEAADGVLIVMPEYNRSFPGVLKNALDWASRPYGKSSWRDKPVAVTGATAGAIGTAAGQAQLRSLLPILGFVVMGQPELYFQDRPGLIDDEHAITDEKTKGFVARFVERFGAWVEAHGTRAST